MAISKNFEQLSFGIGVAAAVITGVAIPLVVNAYQPLLDHFGGELPNLTRWFIDTRWLFLLLPLVVVAAWIAWPIRAMRSVAALAIGVGAMVIFVPLAVFAMYYPIMLLGALV